MNLLWMYFKKQILNLTISLTHFLNYFKLEITSYYTIQHFLSWSSPCFKLLHPLTQFSPSLLRLSIGSLNNDDYATIIITENYKKYLLWSTIFQAFYWAFFALSFVKSAYYPYRIAVVNSSLHMKKLKPRVIKKLDIGPRARNSYTGIWLRCHTSSILKH